MRVLSSVATKYALLLPLCAATLLQGCIPLAFVAGAGTVATVSQERSVGSSVDDSGIYLSLKAIYAKESAGDIFSNISVKVVEGRVLLAGNVNTAENQIEAVRLAWTVKGVREVINEIQVNDQSGFINYTKDAWISNQIRSRLLLTKGIRSVNFSVITVNQVVYIMGLAQDQDELSKVTNVASTTSYVKQVVSYAKLRNDSTRNQ